MKKADYIIETAMEEKDYKKFLYLATFFKNAYTIPVVAIIAMIGAIIITWEVSGLHLVSVLISWVILFVVSVATICFQVERKNKKRVQTDKTGALHSKVTLSFYEDEVSLETTCVQGSSVIRYNQFYQLIESKEYFIFYINANQASLIRKKDVESLEDFQHYLKTKFENNYKEIRR